MLKINRLLIVMCGVGVFLSSCGGSYKYNDNNNDNESDLVITSSQIKITKISDLDSTLVGTGVIKFSANITGKLGESSTLIMNLSNPDYAIVSSNPKICRLEVGILNSCEFTIIPNLNANLIDSITGLPNYEQKIEILFTANNNVPIINSSIFLTISIPHAYLQAPMEGKNSESNLGITFGSTGLVKDRFTFGLDSKGNSCSDNEEIMVDALTGLTWTNSIFSGGDFSQASNYVANLNTCGYSDWRMPTINELYSLLNYGTLQKNSTPIKWLKSQRFTGLGDTETFWSSTPGGYYHKFVMDYARGIPYRSPENIHSGAIAVRDSSIVESKNIARPIKTGPTKTPNGVDAIGVANGNSGVEWPEPRFEIGVDNNKDCILDRLTGLMWPRNGRIGFQQNNVITGSQDDLRLDAQPNYENVDIYRSMLDKSQYATVIKTLNTAPIKLCGHSDWRIPSVNELRSLLNYSICEPDAFVCKNTNADWMNEQGFIGVIAAWYLTSTVSTTDVYESGYNSYWLVGMDDINLDNGYGIQGSFLLPVRGGK